jgi:glutathione peroxidase-family protein
MFAKIDVNGETAHPLYQFLRNNSSLYDAKTG